MVWLEIGHLHTVKPYLHWGLVNNDNTWWWWLWRIKKDDDDYEKLKESKQRVSGECASFSAVHSISAWLIWWKIEKEQAAQVWQGAILLVLFNLFQHVDYDNYYKFICGAKCVD